MAMRPDLIRRIAELAPIARLEAELSRDGDALLADAEGAFDPARVSRILYRVAGQPGVPDSASGDHTLIRRIAELAPIARLEAELSRDGDALLADAEGAFDPARVSRILYRVAGQPAKSTELPAVPTKRIRYRIHIVRLIKLVCCACVIMSLGVFNYVRTLDKVAALAVEMSQRERRFDHLVTPSSLPEPASITLFGSGMVALLAFYARRRNV